MWRALIAGGLTALAALAISACGSSGPSAEDEVREAAVRVVGSEDTREFCRLVSDRYIEEVLGDGGRAACEKSTLAEANPGTPTVSAVTIEGEDESRAVAAVEISGGQLGGSAGHLEMVHEGERWLLVRYGDDFLRSSFAVALRKVDEGALATPSMKTCMGAQVAKLPDNRLRQLTYDASTDAAAMIKGLLPLAENCPEAMAEYGAKALTEDLDESGEGPAYVACVREELEDSLYLTDIAPALIGENPDVGAVFALEGLAVAAKKACLD